MLQDGAIMKTLLRLLCKITGLEGYKEVFWLSKIRWNSLASLIIPRLCVIVGEGNHGGIPIDRIRTTTDTTKRKPGH